MEDLKVTASGYDFAPAHAAMQRYVDANLLAGVSSAVLVGRDLVDVNCAGWADKEAQTPLRTDHIFRVFSNTKLITSCAALLLFEEGKFGLDDPIEKFIPQLGNRKVLRAGATSLDQTEPAKSSITIRQLLSHSAGLSYGFFDPGTVIFNALNERGVHNPNKTLAEMVDVLADLPLIYQPGTSWEYSLAIDVMARLVEVISGQPFRSIHPGTDPRAARHGRHRLRRAGEGSGPAGGVLRRRGPDGSDEARPDPHRQRALPRRLSAPCRAAQWRRRPGLDACPTWWR